MDLSLWSLVNLFKARRCFYTGEEFDHLDPTGRNHRTIDRVDNSKGYVQGNVVACAHWFNQLKADITKEQVVMLQRGLKRKGIL